MTAMEQPGCLHAGMDVYKWATKLGPAVPGDLLLDCFELARDIRTLDMQASPYDVTTYGLDPVAIETPEGKAEYVARQRGFAERGNVLRARLVEVCEALLALTTAVSRRAGIVAPPFALTSMIDEPALSGTSRVRADPSTQSERRTGRRRPRTDREVHRRRRGSR